MVTFTASVTRRFSTIVAHAKEFWRSKMWTECEWHSGLIQIAIMGWSKVSNPAAGVIFENNIFLVDGEMKVMWRNARSGYVLRASCHGQFLQSEYKQCLRLPPASVVYEPRIAFDLLNIVSARLLHQQSVKSRFMSLFLSRGHFLPLLEAYWAFVPLNRGVNIFSHFVYSWQFTFYVNLCNVLLSSKHL